jgi:hypothetical protein
MAHSNAHSFMFFFGWTRFTGSGYFGMEKTRA